MADTELNESPFKKSRLFAILIIAALFAVGLAQVLTGNSGYVTTAVDSQHLGISGNYGDPIFVELDTITSVVLVDSFEFGDCVDGGTVGKTASGIYSCETYGEYLLYAYTNVPAYVIVTYSDGILVFNCPTKASTEKIYQQLLKAAPGNV